MHLHCTRIVTFSHAHLQIWAKQPLQRGVSLRSAVARGSRGVQGDGGPDQRSAEEIPARQRQMALLRLRLLLLHARLFPLARHLSQQTRKP